MRISFFEMARLHSLLKNSLMGGFLYQGTTSVVPQAQQKKGGL